MNFDASALAAAFGVAESDNLRSTIAGLQKRGVSAGLDRPHRLAQFLAQLAHESARWRYDREIWGPTPAQRRYEGRADLGNTQPGDGSLFRGRTAIQITGRANTTAFHDWCRRFDSNCPDFTETPELMNADPWEGLGPIWYWETRDLNRYADQGDIEMVTRRINGGLNGFDDRLRCYDQAALFFLGAPTVRAFQTDAGLAVDGISGPKTRAAMHKQLAAMPTVSFGHALAAPGAAPDIIAMIIDFLKSILGGPKA